MSGIYLHIPYCRSACAYCDFHFSTTLNTISDMVECMCDEIISRKNFLPEKELQSIYFGGGTPSLLKENELDRLLNTVKHNFAVSESAEITFEINPDDVNEEKLRSWKKAGINRLSIGLQSFNDEELKWMNRAHNALQSEGSVALAKNAGFTNISIDLIYGSKFQNTENWEKTLDKAVAMNVQHISSYNLTIEKNTVLGKRSDKGSEPAVNDELSSEQFLLMRKVLQQNGFIHYEVSNFAKPGFIAVHNSNYWKNEFYLGVGPSAHSYDGKIRRWNISNNARYIKAVKKRERFWEEEELSLKDKYNEYVLTRLRTMWGCDLNEMKKLFGVRYVEHFERNAQKLENAVLKKDSRYILNEKGLLQADGIAASLFAD